MSANFDAFHQAILQLNPRVTQLEWDYFQQGLTEHTLAPKTFFIEADKPNQLLGFVTCGLIRGYYTTEAGEEMTTIFVSENNWVTDYPSLLMNKPSRYNFQCLEPTTLITVSYGHIQQGYEQFVGFERNGRLIAEAILQQQQQRIESFQFDSAEQRYLDFIGQNPDLFNRISLTHLSSFLGIERPSLSRIRRKIVGL
ncbi:Crp/Fnr family transcriptional regulator [Spirosoma oryzicola]|uniref:Crp/Fnr family transcriptional regulator n=1 Tax=Spirosoma oryzicola TaxID=2898794 RepID=UPI001E615783|nr:Crp/Fnr family transcriptional regulator [Spirosoma oryzicola]UHG94380.1 Crp/Fnr family transcriptional regulator [Spirosoma oryzicola]